MFARTRFACLLVVPLLVLMLSALLTTPAYADDEQPPAGTDAAAAADPSSGSVGESQPADASSSDPQPDPAQLTESPPAAEEAASPAEELLASVPEGTEVVVLNENGEAVPLVTQEAGTILMEGDPMWCPAGVLPGGAGCTINHPTFAALLADPIFAGGGPAQAGVIWVRDNYAGADNLPITINGATLTVMKDYALTIKGGWTGVGGTINTAAPSVFDVGLTIANWNADVTISDITFNFSPSGGLSVTTTKNITVTRVTATSNTGTGASLNNAGAGTGNVTVSSGKFNSNSGSGLTIFSNGTVTLSNIQASGNAGGNGAFISNSAASTAKNVTVTGANEFNNNRDNGLEIWSKGAITLNDVTANYNGVTDNSGRGAFLDNTYGANPGPGVTLTGTNIFNGNDDIGLYVLSYGPIKINNLFANSNDDSGGASLDNSSALTAQPVTLTGSSQFKYNGGSGLVVLSAGVVTLSNITANTNGNVGALITNTYGSAVVGVTLTGASAFNENGATGLEVNSDGAITLSNITANGNSSFGVFLQSNTLGQKVTLTGVNTFNENNFSGLSVNSKGPIILNSITAIGNGVRGAYLSNTASSNATPQPVTITGANVFNENGDYGLSISTYGAVTLSNITANYNGWVGSIGGVYVVNNGADPAKPANVTFSGKNTFNGNRNDGLAVFSIGAISLSNVTAIGNGGGTYGSGVGGGVYLYNNFGGVGKGVTLSGVNLFESNYANGLWVESKGAITLSSVTASYNGYGAGGGDGAFLNNSGAATAQKVTLTGVNRFDFNYGDGLEISSAGAVTISNVNTLANGGGVSSGHGVRITNTGGGPASLQPVTISGTNTFQSNYSYGLQIFSYGAVTLSNLNAFYNGYGTVASGGVYIANTGGTTPAAVTLSGVNYFISNKKTGLTIYSLGAITVSNVTANSNGSGVAADGAYLDNSAGSANVTVSGTNRFDSNYTTGLYVVSKGVISANSVTASYNSHGYGAYLDNSGAASPKNVTLSGTNTFIANYYSGVEIHSLGAVTVSKVSSQSNGTSGLSGYGLYIDNNNVGAAGNVTLSGTNILGYNYDDGLRVESNGAITISSLTASGNGAYGAYLNNAGAAAAKVAFTGTNTFSSNGVDGLYVITNGAITSALALIAEYNSSDGIYLDNTGASPAQPVTLSGKVTVTGNSDNGIFVTSLGAITISNLTANSNGTGAGDAGAFLDNSTSSSPLAGVTLLGTNEAGNNYGSGLVINSDGAIKVNNLTASSNGWLGSSGSGAYLDNTSAGAGGGVTLTGVNKFESNYSHGLLIASKGAVTMNSVTASFNANGNGAGVSNTLSGASTPQNVTLTGVNLFESNDANGLEISTYGAITLSNVTAANNTGSGASLYNNVGGATIAKNVTLTGTNTFNDNNGYGLYIDSLGSVTVSNLTANGNNATGAQILNNVLGYAGNVTITGFGTYNGNYAGLSIATNGKVTLNKVTANSNFGADGVNINNASAVTPQAVVITGVNTFNENNGVGLWIISKGAITLSSVTANDNHGALGYGAYLTNSGGTGAITLTGVNTFLNNSQSGLYITSAGNVSVTKSTADGNGGYGVYVNAPGNVTMTCGSYTNNGANGLYVTGGTPTTSVVTLTGIVAAGNFFAPDVDTTTWWDPAGHVVIVRNCPLP